MNKILDGAILRIIPDKNGRESLRHVDFRKPLKGQCHKIFDLFLLKRFGLGPIPYEETKFL